MEGALESYEGEVGLVRPEEKYFSIRISHMVITTTLAKYLSITPLGKGQVLKLPAMKGAL